MALSSAKNSWKTGRQALIQPPHAMRYNDWVRRDVAKMDFLSAFKP
jgi:hypothetical protein